LNIVDEVGNIPKFIDALFVRFVKGNVHEWTFSDLFKQAYPYCSAQFLLTILYFV
jgi:hypothetical protein